MQITINLPQIIPAIVLGQKPPKPEDKEAVGKTPVPPITLPLKQAWENLHKNLHRSRDYAQQALAYFPDDESRALAWFILGSVFDAYVPAKGKKFIQENLPANSAAQKTLTAVFEGLADLEKIPDQPALISGQDSPLVVLFANPLQNANDEQINRVIQFLRLYRIRHQIGKFVLQNARGKNQFTPEEIPADLGFQPFPLDSLRLNKGINERLNALGDGVNYLFQTSFDATPYTLQVYTLVNPSTQHYSSNMLLPPQPGQMPADKNIVLITGEYWKHEGKRPPGNPESLGIFNLEKNGVGFVFRDRLLERANSLMPNSATGQKTLASDSLTQVYGSIHDQLKSFYQQTQREPRTTLYDDLLYIETFRQLSNQSFRPLFGMSLELADRLFTPENPSHALAQVNGVLTELRVARKIITSQNPRLALAYILDGLDRYWSTPPPAGSLMNDARAAILAVFLLGLERKGDQWVMNFERMAGAPDHFLPVIDEFVVSQENAILLAIAMFYQSRGYMPREITDPASQQNRPPTAVEQIEMAREIEGLTVAKKMKEQNMAVLLAQFEHYQQVWIDICRDKHEAKDLIQTSLNTGALALQGSLARSMGFQGETHWDWHQTQLNPLISHLAQQPPRP